MRNRLILLAYFLIIFNGVFGQKLDVHAIQRFPNHIRNYNGVGVNMILPFNSKHAAACKVDYMVNKKPFISVNAYGYYDSDKDVYVRDTTFRHPTHQRYRFAVGYIYNVREKNNHRLNVGSYFSSTIFDVYEELYDSQAANYLGSDFIYEKVEKKIFGASLLLEYERTKFIFDNLSVFTSVLTETNIGFTPIWRGIYNFNGALFNVELNLGLRYNFNK